MCPCRLWRPYYVINTSMDDLRPVTVEAIAEEEEYTEPEVAGADVEDDDAEEEDDATDSDADVEDDDEEDEVEAPSDSE